MNLGKWILGGAIGGFLGAGLWAAIGYFTNSEIGWIAWLVGVLAGVGVRSVAEEDDVGPAPGIVAALLAIAAILLGKFAVVHFLVAGVVANLDLDEFIEPNQFIVAIADGIVDERKERGEPIEWPDGVEPQAPTEQDQFPPDIWEEATAEWDALGPDTQQELKDQQVQVMREGIADDVKGARNKAFKESFGGYDILWLLLALATAFKIGSGISSDDE